MAERLQTVLDDKLAERVRRAAAKDRRSVSEWIALRLEEVLGSDGPSEAEVEQAVEHFRTNPMPPCRHDLAGKRATSFGFVRDCIKCGAAVPV